GVNRKFKFVIAKFRPVKRKPFFETEWPSSPSSDIVLNPVLTAHEGEGTLAPDKGNNALTSKRDAKDVVKNVANTSSPKGDIQNAKDFRLEAQECTRSIVDVHRCHIRLVTYSAPNDSIGVERRGKETAQRGARSGHQLLSLASLIIGGILLVVGRRSVGKRSLRCLRDRWKYFRRCNFATSPRALLSGAELLELPNYRSILHAP
ncbi:hypothetical protein LTR49_028842, partial [Elasticomyces elasticus]